MRKILVPIDGSPSSERAVRHVIDVAKNEDQTEVHLLNVGAGVQHALSTRLRYQTS